MSEVWIDITKEIADLSKRIKPSNNRAKIFTSS